MRQAITERVVITGAITVILATALLNWLVPTLSLFDALRGQGRPALADFFLLVIPALLGWAIHHRVSKRKLPASYGWLALAPVIVAFGINLLNVTAQAAALNGCFTPWCDQQPIVIEINRLLAFAQHSLNALAVAAIGGLYWVAGRN